ncbi:MAG: nuclear transport factor 2 family protein, partial [Bacteroidia bacterium]|nr:nuclear transport factor 2 family protein [Bacteroidia bacterium]
IEAIPAMFTSNANISGASFYNKKWNGFTMTIQEFIAGLKSRPDPKKYKEPVNNWIIHIEGGQLAFVRADATLTRDGKPQSHNIDYFTLVKDNLGWKILNGSYVATAIKE